MPQTICEPQNIVLIVEGSVKHCLFSNGGENVIRLIGTRIIMPRGDTGSFVLPNQGFPSETDIALFSVKDSLTQEVVIEKEIDASGSHLCVFLEHEDTCKLEAKDYIWDITIFRKPKRDIETNEIISGVEVETYYACYKNCVFSLKESVNRR